VDPHTTLELNNECSSPTGAYIRHNVADDPGSEPDTYPYTMVPLLRGAALSQATHLRSGRRLGPCPRVT